ncbi:DUF6082 family protein [uncultured Sneathiella sp.]|uniref:DUF6082 family protein n=1 Tax=uncultured Sneathiella sp. TaxID=879315 RepID=UPI0030EDCDB2|tara:strand:+ start:20976 stop:21407 length:432 start_codon:yes stop_codon:yes gene_type:complete
MATNFEWFTFLQSAGIIASFLFTAYTVWQNRKDKRVSNYLDLTAHHRDIWKLVFENKELLEVLDTRLANKATSTTFEQRKFLTFLFLHLSCAYELQKISSVIKVEGLRSDIKDFFISPYVRDHWEENKRFYNDDFVSFVDKNI